MEETVEHPPKQTLTSRILGLGAFLWYRLMVLLRLKPDWRNPDYAPPAFEGIAAHPYKPASLLPCCLVCGGGKKHKIHG
jgi:hypothetical protein